MEEWKVYQLKSAYEQFREEGYLIFPRIFRGQELEKLRTACNYVLDQYTEDYDRQHANTDFTNMRHLNDSRWHRDAREHLFPILEAIADPRCLGPVEQIFDGPSLFRCTSYFVNPRYATMNGDWHRDFQGQDEQEERRRLEQAWKGEYEQGFGLQFQIALVDNDDIEYVPYSVNRYDSPEEAYIRLADNKSHCREEGMPNAIRVALKAGDAVVFNPYGLHRGRYHRDIPRRTLMLTYTPLHDPIHDHFANQPWFDEVGYLDGLSPRAVAYFQQFADTYRGLWAKQG